MHTHLLGCKYICLVYGIGYIIKQLFAIRKPEKTIVYSQFMVIKVKFWNQNAVNNFFHFLREFWSIKNHSVALNMLFKGVQPVFHFLHLGLGKMFEIARTSNSKYQLARLSMAEIHCPSWKSPYELAFLAQPLGQNSVLRTVLELPASLMWRSLQEDE